MMLAKVMQAEAIYILIQLDLALHISAAAEAPAPSVRIHYVGLGSYHWKGED